MRTAFALADTTQQVVPELLMPRYHVPLVTDSNQKASYRLPAFLLASALLPLPLLLFGRGVAATNMVDQHAAADRAKPNFDPTQTADVAAPISQQLESQTPLPSSWADPRLVGVSSEFASPPPPVAIDQFIKSMTTVIPVDSTSRMGIYGHR